MEFDLIKKYNLEVFENQSIEELNEAAKELTGEILDFFSADNEEILNRIANMMNYGIVIGLNYDGKLSDRKYKLLSMYIKDVYGCDESDVEDFLVPVDDNILDMLRIVFLYRDNFLAEAHTEELRHKYIQFIACFAYADGGFDTDIKMKITGYIEKYMA